MPGFFLLHRACSTIIINPTLRVKFHPNEHLKKDFSELLKPKAVLITNELFGMNSNLDFFESFVKSKTVIFQNKLKINNFLLLLIQKRTTLQVYFNISGTTAVVGIKCAGAML